MFKKSYNKKFKAAGFTLIELIIVIAVLGILAGIAVPRLNGFRTSAANKVDEANASILTGIAHNILAETGSFPEWEASFDRIGESVTPYLAKDVEIQNANNEFNYDSSTGIVTVSGSDVGGVDIPPTKEQHSITFVILDDKGSPVPGAAVMLNSSSIYTNESGQAPFKLEDGIYSYKIAKAGYENYHGAVTVNGADKAMNVILKKIPSDTPQLPIPTVTAVLNDKNGKLTVTVTGTPGAKVILRKDSGKSITFGTLSSSGTAQFGDINSNQLTDVILTKSGWVDSEPWTYANSKP